MAICNLTHCKDVVFLTPNAAIRMPLARVIPGPIKEGFTARTKRLSMYGGWNGAVRLEQCLETEEWTQRIMFKKPSDTTRDPGSL